MMEVEGSLNVLARVKKRSVLMQQGHPSYLEIRPALMALGGTMRGVYAGGQVTALQECGLAQAFHVACGNSTGSPAIAYMLALQARSGTTIYSQECTSPEFISFKRYFFGSGPAVNLKYLAEVFRGSTGKRLKEEILCASPTIALAVATEARTGIRRMIDMKTCKSDVAQALHASVSIPGLGSGEVLIDGTPYLDGSITDPFPAELLCKVYSPTDVLVLANRPKNYRKSLTTELISKFALRGLPARVQKSYTQREERFAEGVEFLRLYMPNNHLILWSDSEIGSFTRNSVALAAAAERSRAHLARLLENN